MQPCGSQLRVLAKAHATVSAAARPAACPICSNRWLIPGDDAADVSPRRALAVPACSLLESLSNPFSLRSLGRWISSIEQLAFSTGPGHRSFLRRVWGLGSL